MAVVAPHVRARRSSRRRRSGRARTVHGELGEFATAVGEVPELRGLLANPQIEREERAAALGEILADADELVRNFVLLALGEGARGRARRGLPRVRRARRGRARRLTVELTTAYELSDDEAASIVKKIEQSSGRTVEATRAVDPRLIGGIVLQVGSHRLDASVKGRLDRLRHELGQGELTAHEVPTGTSLLTSMRTQQDRNRTSRGEGHDRIAR